MVTSIPAQDQVMATAAAFRHAEFHVRFCEGCDLETSPAELCTVGQKLFFDAASVMKPAQQERAEPRPYADGGISDTSYLHDVHQAVRSAGGTLTPEVHRTLDALRTRWDQALHAAQKDAADARIAERMTELRPEFFEHADVEAIRGKAKQARLNRTRWQNRLLRLEALERTRLKQIAAGTWPPAPDAGAPAPEAAGLLGECPQNRTGTFIRITDPVVLGPHFYQPDGDGVQRCTWCGTAAHWGGEPATAAIPPTYVYNAQSVNRTTKHLPDPADPKTTRCPRSFTASKPIDLAHAGLLGLCGGCRRAVTGEQD